MALQLSTLLFVCGISCLQRVDSIVSKSCPQSIPTETVVQACPKDKTEWIKAKEKKQCNLIIHNCTEKDKFQYHCLPNKVLDMLVEVCAPTKVIVGQHCPYYDIELHSIEPNFNQRCNSDTCPKVYSSNEAYRYKSCYEEIKKKDTRQISPGNKLSLEVSDSYPELAIGIYIICGLLVVVLVFIIIRFICLYPCCKCCTECQSRRRYQFRENKTPFEKEQEMKLVCKEERNHNGV